MPPQAYRCDRDDRGCTLSRVPDASARSGSSAQRRHGIRHDAAHAYQPSGRGRHEEWHLPRRLAPQMRATIPIPSLSYPYPIPIPSLSHPYPIPRASRSCPVPTTSYLPPPTHHHLLQPTYYLLPPLTHSPLPLSSLCRVPRAYTRAAPHESAGRCGYNCERGCSRFARRTAGGSTSTHTRGVL